MNKNDIAFARVRKEDFNFTRAEGSYPMRFPARWLNGDENHIVVDGYPEPNVLVVVRGDVRHVLERQVRRWKSPILGSHYDDFMVVWYVETELQLSDDSDPGDEHRSPPVVPYERLYYVHPSMYQGF